MHSIEACRTAALGGHMHRCDSCGFERPVYNSCRNRHCPKCQSTASADWVDRQKADLLPVGYFHVVFTVPHELNPLFLTNKRALCTILFRAVAETLSDFGRTHLGGRIGFLAILHTWDQTLGDHFHLHCLIPGGAFSPDETRWIPARRNFLFHVRALSVVFRAKFMDHLMHTFDRKQLQFPGRTAPLGQAGAFRSFMASLRKKRWVVYAKRPFSSPDTVLDYLGRYTHRVAIANHRILSVDDGHVSFLYRDRNDDRHRRMTLPADEFIRRFLLHVLPHRFVRIRHFGLLANRGKTQRLERCRQLIGAGRARASRPAAPRNPAPDLSRCPSCLTGTLIAVILLLPVGFDSS